MMGEQVRSESHTSAWKSRFPEDHLMRRLDRYIDFSFVRERLKGFYSSTGRPSIDPQGAAAHHGGRPYLRHYQRATSAR